MSDAKSLVPLWVRAAVGLLALANLAYGVMGYLRPASMFPALDLANTGALDVVHQFAARNTAIGVALCLVALVGVPETIAILMIIRFLIEGQDLVLLILNGGPGSTWDPLLLVSERGGNAPFTATR